MITSAIQQIGVAFRPPFAGVSGVHLGSAELQHARPPDGVSANGGDGSHASQVPGEAISPSELLDSLPKATVPSQCEK